MTLEQNRVAGQFARKVVEATEEIEKDEAYAAMTKVQKIDTMITGVLTGLLSMVLPSLPEAAHRNVEEVVKRNVSEVAARVRAADTHRAKVSERRQ